MNGFKYETSKDNTRVLSIRLSNDDYNFIRNNHLNPRKMMKYLINEFRNKQKSEIQNI